MLQEDALCRSGCVTFSDLNPSPPCCVEHAQPSGPYPKEGLNPELKVRRSLSDPASRSGASQASEDQSGSLPQKEASGSMEPESELRTASTVRGINYWQKDDQLATQSSTQTLPAREEKARPTSTKSTGCPLRCILPLIIGPGLQYLLMQLKTY